MDVLIAVLAGGFAGWLASWLTEKYYQRRADSVITETEFHPPRHRG